MKFKCNEIEERLSEFLDDVIEESEKAEFQEHIDKCEACANEYIKLNALVRELNTLPDEPLPPDFKEKLHNRLVKESKTIVYSYFTHNWKKYSAVAAGILLVILIGTGYYDNITKFETAYVDDTALVTDKNIEPVIDEAENSDEEGQDNIETPQPQPTQTPNHEGYAIEQDNQSNNDVPHQTVQRSSRRQSMMYDVTDDDIVVNHENSPSDVKEKEPLTGSQIPTPSEKPAALKTPMPSETPKASKIPAEDSQMSIAQVENSEIMFSMKEDTGSEKSSGSGARSGLSQPSPAGGVFSSSHDSEDPVFVSVKVRIDSFDNVALVLKDEYNAKVVNKSITLELDNEDFQSLMNLLANYGAIVEQDDNFESDKFNKCVISPK